MLIGFVLAAAAMLQTRVFAADEAEAPEAKLYGTLDVSVEYEDDGEDGSLYLSSNSSHIGFKGSAELTEGLKGVWQVECQANLDETGAEFASRNTYLGLACAGGTLAVGYHDTPFKSLGRKADQFSNHVGDSRNIIGITDCGCDLRAANVLMYTSPTLGTDTAKVQAKVAYTTEDGAEDSSLVSGTVIADVAGLTVGAGYEEHGEAMAGTDLDGDDVIDTTKGENAVRLVAAYKVQNLKVAGLYEMVRDSGGMDGADRDSWGAGLAYTMGKATVKGQYYSTDGLDTLDDAGASMVSLGVDYQIAAKTTVYAIYAAAANDENSRLRVTGGGHGDKISPAAAGDDPYGVAVGVMHKF